MSKITIAAAEQIEQTSGTRDNDVGVGAKRADLRLFTHAAKNGCDGKRKMFGVSADIFLDLHDEFARRRENQHAGAAIRTGGSLRSSELREHWQRERGGLARAGLRDADKIVPRDDRRDGGGLNGRWFGVTGFGDGLQNLGIQAEDLK